MEIILRQTIDTLGRAGQVVKVSDGYARNYLLPRKLAYTVTPGNMKVIESERQSLLRKDAKQQELAVVALEKIGVWKCRPFELSPTQMAIASRFAARLMDASLIPETEQNDGKILAQTSLVQIPLLVTSDKHLLDIDEEALLLAFNEADLLPVHPAHPKRLLRALR